MPPPTPPPVAPTPPLAGLVARAAALHGAGDLPAAERVYAEILQRATDNFDALHGLGLIAIQRGRIDDADRLLQRAIAANPRSAEAAANHFVVLRRLNRHADALAACDRALALKPRYAEALCNRGLALAALSRFDEAITSYDAALAVRAEFPAAHYNRAVALAALGRYGEALAGYDAALAGARPSAEASYNRGVALAALGRHEEALASYDRALEANPDFAAAHNNRGSALNEMKRYAAAVASYDQALALAPGFAAALYNRGIARSALGQAAGAAADLERALALDPALPFARGMLLHARMQQADWRGYDAAAAAVVADNRAGGCAADPLTLLAVTDDTQAQLACARTWVRTRCPPHAPLAQDGRRARGRIRVAYLSADFREHALAHLMTDVFERHDRGAFETVALSYGPAAPGPLRTRLEAAFDRFIDVRNLSDEAIAARLHADEIDIAVDLAGHTEDARTGVFARRPAPVQVNYLGFPGTMGADFIDYVIADRFVIPEAQRDACSESVVWLPDTYQANAAPHAIALPPPRASLGLPDDGFVFCSFNSTFKVTPAAFDGWMRILQAVPGSVLWLVGSSDGAIANLRREAAARGVAPARLAFAPRVPYALHLARCGAADLFLDTMPFNGGATVSDALRAGLPVVACAGEAFAARMAGSLLSTVGLPELVATSPADYEALAIALAHDATRYRALRDRLAAARAASPLFDPDRFRRHLEAAYATMWRKHQAGETPAAFSVPPVG